jgi:hypothetical protein
LFRLRGVVGLEGVCFTSLRLDSKIEKLFENPLMAIN